MDEETVTTAVNPEPVHVAEAEPVAKMTATEFEAQLQAAYERGKAEVMAELAKANAITKGMATAAEKSLKGDAQAVVDEFHKIVQEWHAEISKGGTVIKEKADALLIRLGLMK